MPPRAFTVQQANDLVPDLERLLDRIEGLKERMRGLDRKVQVLETLWGEDVRAPSNPDHIAHLEHRAGIRRAVRGIEELINDRIIARGLRFPSGGLESGLIDFPTTLQGRWIFLCWQRGEARVGHWHELNGGYRGRQEITPEQAGLIGIENDPARDHDPPDRDW